MSGLGLESRRGGTQVGWIWMEQARLKLLSSFGAFQDSNFLEHPVIFVCPKSVVASELVFVSL